MTSRVCPTRVVDGSAAHRKSASPREGQTEVRTSRGIMRGVSPKAGNRARKSPPCGSVRGEQQPTLVKGASVCLPTHPTFFYLFIHSSIYSFFNSFPSFTHSICPPHSFLHPPVHSFFNSFHLSFSSFHRIIHSFTHPFMSSTHSFHSFTPTFLFITDLTSFFSHHGLAALPTVSPSTFLTATCLRNPSGVLTVIFGRHSCLIDHQIKQLSLGNSSG